MILTRCGNVVVKRWTNAGCESRNGADGVGEITGVMAQENLRLAGRARRTGVGGYRDRLSRCAIRRRYRPTTACAEFVRVRDGYCTEPGCPCSAFASDLDHVTEYDRLNPIQGGATSSENLNAKCRFGHLHKTFGDWIDVQYRDNGGHLVTDYRTPERFTILGDAETLEDFFPNLRRIRYEQPTQAPTDTEGDRR